MNGGTLLALGIAYLTGAASGLWLGFKLWRVTYITRAGPVGRL